MASPPLRVREPWYRRFQGLMPYQVREILLVSSAYDAFVLEEDGPLTERLVSGYSELSLTSVPRITHVSTAAAAMNLISQRRFDLVITVVRVEDSDAGELSLEIQDHYPDLPVVLLTFDEADLRQFPDETLPETIERAFLWTGDAGTLIAAIKLIEDLRNVEHDTGVANVQVILVVEDSIRAYSSFLAILYPELLQQSHSMIHEAHNDLHRLMRIRARPKILLANEYNDAVVWHHRFRNNMLALITDMRFPRNGVEHPDAGVDLVRAIRSNLPDLPVLILSAEEDLAERAADLEVWGVAKHSPAFPTRIREFLKEAVGFGDFVFRMPDGRPLERSRNVYEMEQAIHRVPAESIKHHADRHDFSVWLKARSMFELAAELRPRTVSDFAGIEAVRQYLAEVLQQARDLGQEGIISDVSAPPLGAQTRFVRVGRGSLGGKGRGIAFTNSLLVRHDLLDHFPGLQVRIPKTVALGTEAFERFIEGNAATLPLSADEFDLQRWQENHFDPDLERHLEAMISTLKGPLAVRSSSVLEDSRFQPFAGVYSTYMLPNNHRDEGVRFSELLRAVKSVYASIYSKTALTYLASTPHVLEDQRMAVVIQQVAGQRYGDRWYPLMSGVAQSRNYYPVGPQRAEDGVAIVALGLGEIVARGGTALRFSPGCPHVLPQFPDARAFTRLSQSYFFALDLSQSQVDFAAGPRATLVRCELSDAEDDGILSAVGSVYSIEDDVLRDNLKLHGPRVVTFNNILRWNAFPLAEALSVLLRLLKDAIGGEVEIEFAVDSPGQGTRLPRLYVLQLRPMPPHLQQGPAIDMGDVIPDQVLIDTHRALGHGVEHVHDVVYIKHHALGSRETRAAALQVRDIAGQLHDAQRPYLLIGPGRWGTSDPALGIPVEWRDIAGAKVIVEVPLKDRHVEPSQGSHFFHNLTALRIGYLTLAHDIEARFDQAWLDAQPAARETDLVRHVAFAEPLVIRMDGLQGRAIATKPQPPE